MLTVDRHGLPSALAERLTDEVRASFAETPREGRFKFLAQALNLDEAALLAEVHKTGTISTEEYVDKGTRLVAAVPLSLRNRLEKACVTAATPFSAADVTAKEPVKSHSAP